MALNIAPHSQLEYRHVLAEIFPISMRRKRAFPRPLVCYTGGGSVRWHTTAGIFHSKQYYRLSYCGKNDQRLHSITPIVSTEGQIVLLA